MPADSPNALVPVTTLPTASEWQTISSMGAALVKSGLLPAAVKTPEAAAAIILKGRELCIPPMQAFSHIHVISGKPTCSSELQLALLARGGVTWEITEGDGSCSVTFRRAGWPDYTGRYTLAEAKAAGLTSKDSWKNYPANMLRARAISNGARVIGPDLLCGMSYTPEELGAEVDEDEQPVQEPVLTEATVTTVEPASEPVPPKPPSKPKRTVADAMAAVQRDWPGERLEQDLARISHNCPEPADRLQALILLYRAYYDDMVKEIKHLELQVANGADHLENLRNKYVGEVDSGFWTPKEHTIKLQAYLSHLRDLFAQKEA